MNRMNLKNNFLRWIAGAFIFFIFLQLSQLYYFKFLIDDILLFLFFSSVFIYNYFFWDGNFIKDIFGDGIILNIKKRGCLFFKKQKTLMLNIYSTMGGCYE